ncbi:MAG TPA: hypothetical protein VHG90_15640 [Acidimicrobiales bacterium]|nr:hypothetical protein [Acidimicrobiales bacterium]
MSDLVIRAPIARFLAPPRKAAATVEPTSTTEAAPVAEWAGAARPWHLPEHDDDLDTRSALGRVSAWFMPPG